MDIPYALWNETSAEVADLKKQVWRLKDLYFCTGIILKKSDSNHPDPHDVR